MVRDGVPHGHTGFEAATVRPYCDGKREGRERGVVRVELLPQMRGAAAPVQAGRLPY